MTITIEKVRYNTPKDARIMEAVLTQWFKNPKELNLTDPRMPYPFNYNKWVTMTYTNQNIQSFVVKSDNWIIGMGDLMLTPELKRAHALHIFIDEHYRKQGLGKRMIEYFESISKKEKMDTFTLRLISQHVLEKEIYENMGFQLNGKSKWGSPIMEKKLF